MVVAFSLSDVTLDGANTGQQMVVIKNLSCINFSTVVRTAPVHLSSSPCAYGGGIRVNQDFRQQLLEFYSRSGQFKQTFNSEWSYDLQVHRLPSLYIREHLKFYTAKCRSNIQIWWLVLHMCKTIFKRTTDLKFPVHKYQVLTIKCDVTQGKHHLHYYYEGYTLLLMYP